MLTEADRLAFASHLLLAQAVPDDCARERDLADRAIDLLHGVQCELLHLPFSDGPVQDRISWKVADVSALLLDLLKRIDRL